ncbi:MAG: aminoacyl-tRNA hydrolase [Gammaproteobacteria bacterium]|jgi:PTH1 family peptidyl-tRNA hydrolase|nr:aminoacyl-tRNA hydrolase [Gammaproteobacteria bacterium]MDP6098131.1 aminoacyl-tRNA hydrolase [Gammaproteobacteria bacterium]MDP7456125.1 aminoacyl-tRNA hydrolase [Gammaproteobacteria bacterium]|tara:strand:+ start:1880 stop:2476 length:597 start_codon:yes stop_codon:yes gene_type:complete
MSGNPLKLIVGLGNPGPQHDSNRHNAGVIFLHHLCKSYDGTLRGESKFYGEYAAINIAGRDVKLLFPATYMNNSGRAVAAICNFFKIEPENMLVAYDEIDFEVGITRLKEGGGHGGHNGIRDIISALGGKKDFYRLRIGVGHPGHKSMVSNHVLSDPSRSEADVIFSNIEDAILVIPKAVVGDWEEAMQQLHTENGKD